MKLKVIEVLPEIMISSQCNIWHWFKRLIEISLRLIEQTTFLMRHIWCLSVILDLSQHAAWRSEILNSPSDSNVFKSIFGCSLRRDSFFTDAKFFCKMNTWGSRDLGSTQAGEGQTHLFYLLTSAIQRK